MRCLVTGGSGYFGSLLLHRLCQQGHECSVLDIDDAGDRPAEVRFFQADIRDETAVRRACLSQDWIFHNVAQVPLAKSRHQFDSVNIAGTEHLLCAALDSGCAKVIHTSSSAVLGVPPANPVTEEALPSPAEAYGRAKLAAEALCHQYSARGLDVSIIRPRTILGHGRLGIFQILFEWIREGRNVPVFNQGANLYQFIHADDLAEACILAACRPGAAIYHCGTDRYGTMREVLEHLCRHAATGARIKSVPMAPAAALMKWTGALGLSPLAPYHALMYGQSIYFDISKARQELGWQPCHSNNEMFVESYDWYLRHRQAILAGKKASPHRSAVKEGILALAKRLF